MTAIRPATEADLPTIAEIHLKGWELAYGAFLPADQLAAMQPHKRLPLCARAIWAQIQRGRLSPAVHAALLAALGEDAWRFATGQTDTLTDVEGARE